MLTPIITPNALNVPDKYNGNQLDCLKKYALFMDYLILNYEGVPTFNFQGIKAEFQDYGTKVFDKRVDLIYNGQRFGILTFSPRSKIIDSNLCQLKIENHLFYTMPLPDLLAQLQTLTNAMGLTFKNVNRLDVALDFNDTNHDVNDLLRKICNNDYLISGREKDINIYSSTKKGKMTFQGIRIGSRTSSRFLRLYNKTIESKKSLKTYIFDAWSVMGLVSNDATNVWRYEYQLSSKFLRELEGLTLETLFSSNGIFNLLKTANSNHFQIRYNTGKSEVNKEKEFNFLDWSIVAKTLKLIEKTVTKLKRVITETLIGQQRMIKSLLRSYFSTGQRTEYVLPLKLTLRDFDLWEWFGKKLPFYIDEFQKKQLIKSFDRTKFNDDLILEI